MKLVESKKSPVVSSRETTLRAYNDGLLTGDFYPVYYGIEVTRLCNLACVMCPHPQFAAAEKGHMNLDLFKQIVDQIAPHAEIIKLHWIGEPLLHPSIVEMTKYAKQNSDAKIYMSTNATMLKGELAEGIRTFGLDELIISLDGNSKNTYEHIRVHGNFDKVVTNVEAFLQKVMKYGGPVCHLKMIQFRANVDESKAFQKRWSKFPNVMTDVTWLSDWAGNVENTRALSEFHNPIESSERVACSDLWFKMQIDWRGNVALCCFDANNTVNIGNLVLESLENVWQSSALQAFRQRHLEKRYNGICKNCFDWATPSEYEFWYSDDELIRDPQSIWYKWLVDPV